MHGSCSAVIPSHSAKQASFIAIKIFCYTGGCYGSWKWPIDCTDKCDYSAEWCANGDEVTFVVEGPGGGNGFIAIGFSKENRTVQFTAEPYYKYRTVNVSRNVFSCMNASMNSTVDAQLN